MTDGLVYTPRLLHPRTDLRFSVLFRRMPGKSPASLKIQLGCSACTANEVDQWILDQLHQAR